MIICFVFTRKKTLSADLSINDLSISIISMSIIFYTHTHTQIYTAGLEQISLKDKYSIQFNILFFVNVLKPFE